MTTEPNSIYCALDLEMSGFDPEADEILEIGFVFFSLDKQGVKVIEEWTQVFKPTGVVHPKILGLTGISQAELEQAPLISEHIEFLKNKLSHATIVGHSISVDLAFLNNAGLNFQGESIDTLELAQFILPAQQAYNLESLVHSFGIVPTGAHRALADAKATMALLEKLLAVYRGFPESLHREVAELLSGSTFTWAPLLDIEIAPTIIPKKRPHLNDDEGSNINFEDLTSGVIKYLPLGSSYQSDLAKNLQNRSDKTLWVIPDEGMVTEYWQRGFGQAVFSPKEYFDESKFSKFIKKSEATSEELRFALKLMVWKATNWQTFSLVDLNTSFFGGQFKAEVSMGHMPEPFKDKVLICTHSTFLNLEKSWYEDRLVVIEKMADFERALSKTMSQKASWGFANYALKSIYNPELEVGDSSKRDKIIDLLARTDLFFGLVKLLLEPFIKNGPFLSELELRDHDYEFNKIEKAANHYVEALETFATEEHADNLKVFLSNLRNFFADHKDDPAGMVRWIEVRDEYCAFVTQPLFIDSSVTQKITQTTVGVCWLDYISADVVTKYYTYRLGLMNLATISPESTLENKDLEVIIDQKPAMLYEVASAITEESLPYVVSFSNLATIKEFYKEYHVSLNEIAVLYAQGYSGGSNKIIRNFGIREKSLLLVTHEFLSQVPYNSIKAKNLRIIDLEPENFLHPYSLTLKSVYMTKFGLDLSQVVAISQFGEIVKRLYSPTIKNIQISGDELQLESSRLYLEAIGLTNIN